MAETATDTQTLEPAANTELSEFDAETLMRTVRSAPSLLSAKASGSLRLN